jgi:hypothetical protein
MAKQYGSSPISGVHLKNCNFESFHQSPASGSNPNRPVTRLICVAEGGIEYDNVRLDGELYSPPSKSVQINSLIFTNSSTGEAREISAAEDLKKLIEESRTDGTEWDISIKAKVEGFDYKGKHYNIGDSIDNSTYTGPLGGAPRNPSTILEKYNGGVLYVNGQSPHIQDADREFPYYKSSGIPAYEAFVRVNTNSPVNDWTTDTETADTGPNYVIDLRTPGRVTSLGDGEYLIKLRENVAMGGTTPGRAAGFNSLNKVEVVVRNGLFNEDQDFVFFSAIPRVTGSLITPSAGTLTLTFDQAIDAATLKDAQISVTDSVSGAAVTLDTSSPQLSDDKMNVTYALPFTVNKSATYSLRLNDLTSKVLGHIEGNVPLGSSDNGGGSSGCDTGAAFFLAALGLAAAGLLGKKK